MNIASIFRYCPGCGGCSIDHIDNRYLSCTACGHIYFHNVATAAGIILHTVDAVIAVKRNREPAKGRLGLPGGFADPGESAEECAVRECMEETGITVEKEELKYLVSFPNLYSYKGVVYDTCDLFFTCLLPDLPDLSQSANSEVEELVAVPLNRLHTADFAFPSAKKAVSLWLSKHR